MTYNPLNKEEQDKFDKSQQEFYEKYIKAQKGELNMTFENYKIQDDSITLDKKELEEIRDHYCKVADMFKPKKKDDKLDFRYPFFIGKADVVVDILKMFERS